MRLEPVVLAFATSPSKAIAMAAQSSRTTHGDRDAVDGRRYLAALMLGALGGVSKEDPLGDLFEPVPDVRAHEPLAPAITEVAAGSFRRRHPRDQPRGALARSGAVGVPSRRVVPRWRVARRQWTRIRRAPSTASSRVHSTAKQLSRGRGAARWWREQPSQKSPNDCSPCPTNRRQATCEGGAPLGAMFAATTQPGRSLWANRLKPQRLPIC
jgi:hypothetical protein